MKRIQRHNALIGFGANLGNIKQTFDFVCEELQNFATSPIELSSIYESAPHGLSNQPDYVNAVILLQTSANPTELLRFLLLLEQQRGRRRVSHSLNLPRPLDLDLLLYDDLVMRSQDLVIPHPRMHMRNFVLLPAREVAPGWIHPILQISIDALCTHCDDPLPIRKL
ncbi:MAG: 2-amino-4-hydroxy-6-hydroxymethyldihydropteridine diphosphokinase [Bradymonadales bacterium]|jgi:2-amino-4-hydroxy-6-hydroxymethyldihydropteridine diphosphokinase